MIQLPIGSGLRALPPARRDVILALKRRGLSTVEVLASDMEYSVGAVRSLLVALAAEGFVDHRPERIARGRPRHRYFLTGAGEDLFPQLSGPALELLIDVIKERFPEIAGDIRREMVERWAPSPDEAHRIAALAPGRQGEAVAAFLGRLGFIADARPSADGSLEVSIFHCPVLGLARRYPAAICEGERMLLGRCGEWSACQPMSSRIEGAAVCSYRLVPAIDQAQSSA